MAPCKNYFGRDEAVVVHQSINGDKFLTALLFKGQCESGDANCIILISQEKPDVDLSGPIQEFCNHEIYVDQYCFVGQANVTWISQPTAHVGDPMVDRHQIQQILIKAGQS